MTREREDFFISCWERYYGTFHGDVRGNLHIIVDDGNVRDSDILYCLRDCLQKGDLIGIEFLITFSELSEELRTQMYELGGNL